MTRTSRQSVWRRWPVFLHSTPRHTGALRPGGQGTAQAPRRGQGLWRGQERTQGRAEPRVSSCVRGVPTASQTPGMAFRSSAPCAAQGRGGGIQGVPSTSSGLPSISSSTTLETEGSHVLPEGSRGRKEASRSHGRGPQRGAGTGPPPRPTASVITHARCGSE